MTKQFIEKAIRIGKPLAQFVLADKSGLLYKARIDGLPQIHFAIPYSDIGDAKFRPQMESQLLIRWLVPIVEENSSTL